MANANVRINYVTKDEYPQDQKVVYWFDVWSDAWAGRFGVVEQVGKQDSVIDHCGDPVEGWGGIEPVQRALLDGAVTQEMRNDMYVEEIQLNELESKVFCIVANAPPVHISGVSWDCTADRKLLQGKQGITAEGVCKALGYPEFNSGIWSVLDKLHRLGVIRRMAASTMTVYHI